MVVRFQAITKVYLQSKANIHSLQFTYDKNTFSKSWFKAQMCSSHIGRLKLVWNPSSDTEIWTSIFTIWRHMSCHCANTSRTRGLANGRRENVNEDWYLVFIILMGSHISYRTWSLLGNARMKLFAHQSRYQSLNKI